MVTEDHSARLVFVRDHSLKNSLWVRQVLFTCVITGMAAIAITSLLGAFIDKPPDPLGLVCAFLVVTWTLLIVLAALAAVLLSETVTIDSSHRFVRLESRLFSWKFKSHDISFGDIKFIFLRNGSFWGRYSNLWDLRIVPTQGAHLMLSQSFSFDSLFVLAGNIASRVEKPVVIDAWGQQTTLGSYEP